MPVAPVTLKVFHNGQPLKDGQVFFHPVKSGRILLHRMKDDSGAWIALPQGVVASDGSATLTSYKADDGAPDGDYVVTVVWKLPLPQDEQSSDEERGPDQFVGRYADPATSNIRVTIAKGAATPSKIDLE